MPHTAFFSPPWPVSANAPIQSQMAVSKRLLAIPQNKIIWQGLD